MYMLGITVLMQITTVLMAVQYRVFTIEYCLSDLHFLPVACVTWWGPIGYTIMTLFVCSVVLFMLSVGTSAFMLYDTTDTYVYSGLMLAFAILVLYHCLLSYFLAQASLMDKVRSFIQFHVIPETGDIRDMDEKHRDVTERKRLSMQLPGIKRPSMAFNTRAQPPALGALSEAQDGTNAGGKAGGSDSKHTMQNNPMLSGGETHEVLYAMRMPNGFVDAYRRAMVMNRRKSSHDRAQQPNRCWLWCKK